MISTLPDGRKPIYIVGLGLLVAGSLGVGFARSVKELMFWRFIQVFGASPGKSVGAGVIGDIYRFEQRGTAMGVFLAVRDRDSRYNGIYSYVGLMTVTGDSPRPDSRAPRWRCVTDVVVQDS